MKFENTRVYGIDTAIRSMRMPLQSFDKADSEWIYDEIIPPITTDEYQKSFQIGEKDLDLAHRLLSTGTDSDSKFLRSISVYTELTAPVYYLAELDTYKIGTVRNSSSLQHTGAKRDFTISDFTTDPMYPHDVKIMQETWAKLIETINLLRQMYKETNDYHYFRLMRQLMPMSFNYTISWTANYQVLRTIYFQRRNHRLKEWTDNFIPWIESLPYAKDLITYEGENK